MGKKAKKVVKATNVGKLMKAAYATSSVVGSVDVSFNGLDQFHARAFLSPQAAMARLREAATNSAERAFDGGLERVAVTQISVGVGRDPAGALEALLGALATKVEIVEAPRAAKPKKSKLAAKAPQAATNAA